MNKIIRGLILPVKTSDCGLTENDDALRKICETEFNRYLLDVCTRASSLYNTEHAFNDPLQW